MADPGPVLVVDFAGAEPGPEDREILSHPAVAGVILFTRNYEAPDQLGALCGRLHTLRRRTPLLVTVDHEGGRVQRFRDGFTQLPPASAHGDTYRRDRVQGLAGCREHGRTLAAELRAHGVDLSFAPVLDLGRGLGSVIGDRALATDADTVAVLGVEWIAGMHDAGMAACVKHFPGHGGVAGDSHHESPRDERDLDDIEAADLVPFAHAIAAGVEAVMMAHVVFPALDELPASVSRRWIGDVLKSRMGFDGAVICDDLSMAGLGALGGPVERAESALDAGCDLLPVCNDRAAVIGLLDGLRPRRTEPGTLARIAALRAHTA